jgi:hypothetical protein
MTHCTPPSSNVTMSPRPTSAAQNVALLLPTTSQLVENRQPAPLTSSSKTETSMFQRYIVSSPMVVGVLVEVVLATNLSPSVCLFRP